MSTTRHLRVLARLLSTALLLSGMAASPVHAMPVPAEDPGLLFVTPGGAGTACSQAQPCALATALAQALSGDTIYVAQGQYTGTGAAVVSLVQSITLYGGWNGAPTGPIMRDPAAYPTVLDGQNARRVVHISAGAPTVEGFTITHGSVTGGLTGGGVLVDGADATLRYNRIRANSTTLDGGGIGVNGGSATIYGNLIISNTAGWGGGVRIINDAEVTLQLNTIVGNHATWSGGGLQVECCGQGLTALARNVIADNVADVQDGGGASILRDNVVLENNILSGNRAPHGDGLWMSGSASYPAVVTMTHNTLAGITGTGTGVEVSQYVGLALVNNIVAHFATGIPLPPGTAALSADHNLFWDASDPFTGANPVLADPQLDSTQHLTIASPARDAGAVVPVNIDIDGDPRPVGGYDIGADEFVWRVHLPVALRQ